MTLQDRIFAAIKSAPAPLTEERALAIGLEVIGNDSTKPMEWRDWMKSNGAQLCKLVNGE